MVPEGMTVKQMLNKLKKDFDIDDAEITVSSLHKDIEDPLKHVLRYGDIVNITTSVTDLEHTDKEFADIMDKLQLLGLHSDDEADDEEDDDEDVYDTDDEYEEDDEDDDDEDDDDLDEDDDSDEEDDSEEEDDTSEEGTAYEAAIIENMRRLLKVHGYRTGTLQVRMDARSGDLILKNCK